MEITTLTHKGKPILYLNFSYGDMLDKKQEVLDLIEEAKSYIAKQAPNSLLTLTNVTGLRFSMELVNAIKEFSLHNRPFVKATTLCRHHRDAKNLLMIPSLNLQDGTSHFTLP